MPKPAPLTPAQAKRALANRFGPLADRLRQLNTRFGVRPYRCFLVWGVWAGSERGTPPITYVQETELLPTPKVSSLDSVTFSIFHAGTVQAGSVKLTEVSVQYTYDQLQGLMLPVAHESHIPQPWEFFYEIREDGRGDQLPLRQSYRLLSPPFRDAGKVQWTIMLERISEDRGRHGQSLYLKGKEG